MWFCHVYTQAGDFLNIEFRLTSYLTGDIGWFTVWTRAGSAYRKATNAAKNHKNDTAKEGQGTKTAHGILYLSAFSVV